MSGPKLIKKKEKQWLANFNVSQMKLLSINDLRNFFLLSICMADADLQAGGSLHLLGLIYSLLTCGKILLNLLVGLLQRKFVHCVVVDSGEKNFLSYIFKSLPFIHALSIVVTSGLVFMLYI